MSRNDDLRADDPGGTLETAAATIAAMTVPVVRPLSSSDLNKWAAANGARKAIWQAADDYNHQAFELASAARSAFELEADPLDLSDQETSDMLDGLVLAGVVTQSAADDLRARANTTELKYPGFKPGWLVEARRGDA